MKEAKLILLTNYRGITVDADTELRRNLRAAKAAFINEFMDAAPTETTYYDVTTGDVTTTKPAAQGKCSEHSAAVIQYDATNKTAIWVPVSGEGTVDQECSGSN